MFVWLNASSGGRIVGGDVVAPHSIPYQVSLQVSRISASNEGYPKVRNYGEGPYWLKAATTAFTFKTLLRHYANRALTPHNNCVGDPIQI